jgi:NAD/NADP transhydrogenase beta subunit
VKYAIHPVAGRMRSHDVLLAEPKTRQVFEMEDINAESGQAD